MTDSINLSLALDPNQELSLDDLDLVLGGGSNAVSAAGSGDDHDPQQGGGVNALDLRTSPITGTVTVTSTETHDDGNGPLDRLAETVQTIGHEAADLAHRAGDIVYDTVHPIGEALGQLGHDVIMAIDHQVTGGSSSPGTGG